MIYAPRDTLRDLFCLQVAAEKAELIEEIFDILETLKVSKLLSTDILRCVAGYIIMGLRVSAHPVPTNVCGSPICHPTQPSQQMQKWHAFQEISAGLASSGTTGIYFCPASTTATQLRACMSHRVLSSLLIAGLAEDLGCGARRPHTSDQEQTFCNSHGSTWHSSLLSTWSTFETTCSGCWESTGI